MKKNNKIIIKKTILLIGASRSGKTTIKKVLQDPEYVPPYLDFFAGTIHPNCDKITIKFGPGDFNKKKLPNTEVEYQLNIIDVPGLYERAKLNETIRTNVELVEIMNKFIYDNLVTEKKETFEEIKQKIDDIFFVFTVDGGLSERDVESLKIYKENFKGRKLNLVITRCEELKHDNKKNIIKEIENHKDYDTLFAGFKNILFMGAKKRDDVEQNLCTALKKQVRNIKFMRKLFLFHLGSEQFISNN